MVENRAIVLVALVLLSGCTTDHASDSFHHAALEAPSSPDEELLAPFLACTSPAEFVQLQRGVDMARLVARLDDWSAVRLGALGPMRPEAAEVINRKRASFLVAATLEYGLALAEVFALFVLHSATDEDLQQVLRHLAQDKRLEQTLGQMAVAREQLQRRGLPLSNTPDRPERLGDTARGSLTGLGDVVSSAPMFQVGGSLGYEARRRQLPPPYRQALQEVENALVGQALTPGHVTQGVLDELTFGVPLGFYYLAAGLGHGAHALSQGRYEQATRELTPAALMVALYAIGKGTRSFPEPRGAPALPRGARALQTLELRLEELKATAQRLREQLGSEGLQDVARYLRTDPEAALLVIDGGEAGVAALYEARGNLPRAQAWLSQAKSERPGGPRLQGGAGKSPGGMASLADEAAELPRQVLDAKLLEVEVDVQGPRLSTDVAVLEKELVALEKTPRAGATSHTLWNDYLQYGRERLTELTQGKTVKQGRKLQAPLKWEGYQKLRGLLTRGLAFERELVKLLREETARPKAERRFLQDFNEPRVETYVGVWKPEVGLRYADVLVIEQKPLPGKPPRVESFSFKSRDLSRLKGRALEAPILEDAREALRKYGETLDIRRESLQPLLRQGSEVPVSRVRLIYEGGTLKPIDVDSLHTALKETQKKVPEVEVLFQ